MVVSLPDRSSAVNLEPFVNVRRDLVIPRVALCLAEVKYAANHRHALYVCAYINREVAVLAWPWTKNECRVA